MKTILWAPTLAMLPIVALQILGIISLLYLIKALKIYIKKNQD